MPKIVFFLIHWLFFVHAAGSALVLIFQFWCVPGKDAVDSALARFCIAMWISSAFMRYLAETAP